MSDAHKLQQYFRDGLLLGPTKDALNIVDLAGAIAHLAGSKRAISTDGSEAIVRMIGPADHLVFVAADGFGACLLGPLLAEGLVRAKQATTIRTVFPSTTASAFTSLATGEWPGRHGAVGWFTYIPGIDAVGTIIPFVRSADGTPLTDLGLPVAKAFPVPSLFAGVDGQVLSLLPETVTDSTFSMYVTGGTPRRGYGSFAEVIDVIGSRIRNAAGPTYTYLYLPHVDAAGHEVGFSDQRTLRAARSVVDLVNELAQGVEGRARIVLTADHGGLDAGADQVHLMGAEDSLIKLLRREPSGDSRVVYFHVRRGKESEFEAAFRDGYGERFLLLKIEDAEEMELFGPGRLSCETRLRLGTFIALSRGADVLVYEWPRRPGGGVPHVGYHSGLSEEEMLVPLVVM